MKANNKKTSNCMQIFPPEIMEYTGESLWVSRNMRLQGIYIIAILLILLAAGLSPFIYIGLTSQSRGVIRSQDENNVLQPAVLARIKKIVLSEGLLVQRGDTLVWLDAGIIEEQIERLHNKIEENNAFVADINYLIQDKPQMLATPKYHAEHAELRAKLREQQITLTQAESQYYVSGRLYNKGVEARIDYEQNESKYRLEQQKLASIRNDYANTWQAERTRLELENRDLESQAIRLKKDKSQYFIIAPLSGNITQYTGAKEGNYVTVGQQLAQITSSGNLLAECYISPSDIGYIRQGQEVYFQLDAYDYHQWGLLQGQVAEIFTDVVSVDNQTFFRVRCKLAHDYLKLKNGYCGTIKKGMTLTGRFTLARRSIAQLLFDKVDDWMNPKLQISNGNNN
jgi:HlyD family secretion protein